MVTAVFIFHKKTVFPQNKYFGIYIGKKRELSPSDKTRTQTVLEQYTEEKIGSKKRMAMQKLILSKDVVIRC